MLLAIPVSASDSKNLPHTAEIFKKFGPYAGFQCAIFARLEIENEARVFAEQIKPLFSNLDIHIIDFHSNGATEAAAKHFRAVAQTVSEKYTAGPWYFYELDNTPIQIGWLSKLQREYHESGKAHMGAIVPTRGFSIMQDGSLKPSFGDPHMVGTGIYHHAMGAHSPNIGQLDRSMPWAGPLEPFDIRLRYEVVPHAHNTILIQHNWNTGNYREENGQIVCDDLSGDVNLSHAKPYDGHAVVVHGCKDGSLAKLVLADKITTKASNVGKAESKVVVEEPKSLTGQEGQPPAVGFLAFRVKGVVEASKDRLTAKKIAEQLGLKTEEIIAACSETGSGLKVAGPPKWVSLT